MTKDKLIKLYEKFQSERLNTLFITNFKNISDYEINLILQSKYIDITASLMSNNNFKILNKEIREQILNSINSAKNKTIANYASFLLDDEIVLGSGLITEIVKIISSSQETFQASNALNVATNKNIILASSPLSLIELVSKGKTPDNCFNAMIVATDEAVLTYGPAYTLTKLVSEASTKTKSDLAASIAKNKILLKTPMITTYTQKVATAKTDEEAKLIYSKIRKIINVRKIINENIKLEKITSEKDSNQTVLFWALYQQNPEEAINLLKETVKDNEEITINTKIKRKTK